MRGMARLLPLIVLGLVCLPPAAGAAEPPVLFRFYYSTWLQGTVEKSPADPTGAYSKEGPRPATKGDLEMIAWGHVGLSYSRQIVRRRFETAPGQMLEEFSLQETYNLTLYARHSTHDAFNLFAGGGAGQADYQYKLNGVRQDDPALDKHLPIQRWFAGVEYTFDRIGVRVEYIRVQGSHEAGGRKDELAQRFGYLSLYIPFN